MTTPRSLSRRLSSTIRYNCVIRCLYFNVAFICLHAAASLWQVLSIAIQVTHPEDNLGLRVTAEMIDHLISLLYYKGMNTTIAAKEAVLFANKFHGAPLLVQRSTWCVFELILCRNSWVKIYLTPFIYYKVVNNK